MIFLVSNFISMCFTSCCCCLQKISFFFLDVGELKISSLWAGLLWASMHMAKLIGIQRCNGKQYNGSSPDLSMHHVVSLDRKLYFILSLSTKM